MNVYDIFGYCYPNTEGIKRGELGVSVVDGQPKTYKKIFTPEDYTPWAFTHKKKENLDEVPPCVMGKPLIEYMNKDTVRKALHIPTDVHAWDMCNSETFRYQVLPRGSQWIYESLAGKIRMIHFSGDTDGAVPTQGTNSWTNWFPVE